MQTLRIMCANTARSSAKRLDLHWAKSRVKQSCLLLRQSSTPTISIDPGRIISKQWVKKMLGIQMRETSIGRDLQSQLARRRWLTGTSTYLRIHWTFNQLRRGTPPTQLEDLIGRAPLASVQTNSNNLTCSLLILIQYSSVRRQVFRLLKIIKYLPCFGVRVNLQICVGQAHTTYQQLWRMYLLIRGYKWTGRKL